MRFFLNSRWYITGIIATLSSCFYAHPYVGVLPGDAADDEPCLACLALISSNAAFFSTDANTSSSRLVMAGGSGGIWWSTDGANWNDVSPGGAQLNDVAYGMGTYVVVGNSGTIHYSTDSAVWNDVSPGGSTLNGVAFSGSGFAAAGISGTVHYSADGQNWLAGTSGTGTDLLGISYGGGYFVAVGDSGLIMRSTDGNTWADVSPGGAGSFKSVDYLNGVFVATAWNAESWRSTNSGANWSLVAVPTQNGGPTGLMAGGGAGTNNFVIIEWQGQLSYSSDGTSWNGIGRPGSNDIRDLANSSMGLFGVGYSNIVLQSTDDGVTWNTVATGVGPTPTLGIVAGD